MEKNGEQKAEGMKMGKNLMKCDCPAGYHFIKTLHRPTPKKGGFYFYVHIVCMCEIE